MTKSTKHVMIKITALFLAFSLCLGIGMPVKAGIMQGTVSHAEAGTEMEVNAEAGAEFENIKDIL